MSEAKNEQRYFKLIQVAKARWTSDTVSWCHFADLPLLDLLNFLERKQNWSQIFRDPYFANLLTKNTLKQYADSGARLTDWFQKTLSAELKCLREMQAAINDLIHQEFPERKPHDIEERIEVIRNILIRKFAVVPFTVLAGQFRNAKRLNNTVLRLTLPYNFEPTLTDAMIEFSMLESSDFKKGVLKVEECLWLAFCAYCWRISDFNKDLFTDFQNLMLAPNMISARRIRKLELLLKRVTPMQPSELSSGLRLPDEGPSTPAELIKRRA
jgi:hypothetical protein